jgi:hypothetical protein
VNEQTPMQVNPRANSYNQPSRSTGIDRKSTDTETEDAARRARRDDAITGSQAVLSTSLADALWSIQRSSSVEDNATMTSVEALYQAYAA